MRLGPSLAKGWLCEGFSEAVQPLAKRNGSLRHPENG